MATLHIKPGDRTVAVTVQQRTRSTPQDALRILAPIDLPTVFRPVFPFPGISEVKNRTEAWDHAGPRRNPQFDDGSQADEELTEYTPGSSFAYRLTNFTDVLSRLAAGVRGEFNVSPDGDGALIRWTHEFKPLPGRLDLPVSPVRRSSRQPAGSWMRQEWAG
ncbi:SRPBCC family protein [Streptomyces minutiscleroticus]|uniref:SRPBCC family protein n=1 Tax=Streptomyces minutiscleroticus TaxID=68238 RepID=UPI00331FBEA1